MREEPVDARFRLVNRPLQGTTTDSWGIELVLRALAGSRAPLLPKPCLPHDDHGQYLAYLHGLHFILVSRLGWVDPGKGLRRWYVQGQPVEEPTLAFVKEVWGNDRTLDDYLAWAVRNWRHFEFDRGARAEEPSGWWKHWERSRRNEVNLPIEDWNGPHFEGVEYEAAAIVDDAASILTVSSLRERRAVFITGSEGFYEELRKAWSSLPDASSKQSWKVEVFNRRIGFVGEYRRSTQTGRLYVGRHSVHMLGN